MAGQRSSGPARPDGAGATTAPGGLLQLAKRGWPPAFPLVQLPNAPLVVAGTGLLVAAATEGAVRDLGQATAYAALSAWAWLELTDGANVARRALGAGTLAYVVARVAEALGAA